MLVCFVSRNLPHPRTPEQGGGQPAHTHAAGRPDEEGVHQGLQVLPTPLWDKHPSEGYTPLCRNDEAIVAYFFTIFNWLYWNNHYNCQVKKIITDKLKNSSMLVKSLVGLIAVVCQMAGCFAVSTPSLTLSWPPAADPWPSADPRPDPCRVCRQGTRVVPGGASRVPLPDGRRRRRVHRRCGGHQGSLWGGWHIPPRIEVGDTHKRIPPHICRQMPIPA